MGKTKMTVMMMVARRLSGGPRGPDLGPSATGWSNWVGRIQIMCSGPLRDLYNTPGAHKRAHFGP